MHYILIQKPEEMNLQEQLHLGVLISAFLTTINIWTNLWKNKAVIEKVKQLTLKSAKFLKTHF